MEDWNNVLVSVVKRKCEDKDWNKERVARESGIHIRQLQRYLKGERTPSVEVFFRVVICCGWTTTFEYPTKKFTI